MTVAAWDSCHKIAVAVASSVGSVRGSVVGGKPVEVVEAVEAVVFGKDYPLVVAVADDS